MRQISKCCGANIVGSAETPQQFTCASCGKRCAGFHEAPVTRISGLFSEIKGAHQFFFRASLEYCAGMYGTVRYYLRLPIAYMRFLYYVISAYLSKRG